MKKMIAKAKMAKELAKSRSKLSADMLKSLREKSSMNDMSQPMNDIRRAEFTKIMSEPPMIKGEPVMIKAEPKEYMKESVTKVSKPIEAMPSIVEVSPKSTTSDAKQKVLESLKESMRQEFIKNNSNIGLSPLVISNVSERMVSSDNETPAMKEFKNKVKEATKGMSPADVLKKVEELKKSEANKVKVKPI